MAAHSNDKSIVGQGLLWNARSGMLERVIDFAKAGLSSTDAYYEIGTLPAGFVPRNVALIQLTHVNSASTVKLYKTVEDASSGTATEVASLSATASSALGSVFKPFDPGVVASTAATVTPSMNAQLAVKLGAAFNKGIVKVVISGDRMAGIWDNGDAAPPITPADAVPVNLQ